MSWTKKFESVRALLFTVAALALAITAMWFGAQYNSVEASISAPSGGDGSGTTFPGTGVGAIPDRGATGCGPPAGPPLNVTFNVTGMTGTVTDVNVNLTATHSWVGDVDATLIAPTGQTHILFSRTGATTPTSCGDTSDLNALYTFDDEAATNWWNTVGSVTTPVPTGSYRTAPAGPQPSATTAPPTSMDPVFNGIAPNGTWTLRFNDEGGGDTGSVTAANLTITTGGGPAPPAQFLDFFGNNLTDFAVFTFPTAGGQIRWVVAKNDNPTTTSSNIIDQPWGQSATDSIPNFGNWAGDAKTDFSLRRSGTGTPANTYMVLSNNNPGVGTQSYQAWGTSTTDYVGREGDYNGDGIMDFTVVRTADPVNGGLLTWYVLNSGSNTLTAFNFGTDVTDIPLAGANYDGVGGDDPTVIRIAANGTITWFAGTTSGTILSTTIWGDFDTDFVVPGGDYDGDGRADFMVWRGFGAGTNGVWFLRTATGVESAVPFGTPGAAATRDTALRGGDYDGDGRDDIAVYRPGTLQFIIRRSSDMGTVIQGWGVSGNTNLPMASFGIQ